MENIKICELCREQIIKTEDFESLNCDEKQNINILKNLEINVSKDAKICSNCVNISHLTYDFKTSCLTNNDHLKTLIHPGSNDKLILEKVVVEKTKSESKNEKVCRLCLNFSEVNLLLEVNLEQDVILKDMLGTCLPEIDTNIVQNPLICSICSELLEKLFNFISQCKHTEVLGNLDPKTDVLVTENKAIVTVANNDNNINESFLKEENCEGVEHPELQIKSEDIDVDEDIKYAINDSDCLLKEGEIHTKPSSFQSTLAHERIHQKTRKSTISKLYKCTKCLFQTKYQSRLIRHKQNYEETFKCNLCGFTASNNCEIVKHKKKVHQSLSPAESGLLKCHKCPYITKRKESLDVHNIRWHEDISKVPKYKCDECPYETLLKRRLVDHKIKHRDPSEVQMYECRMCLFETKRKSSLQRHQKTHASKRQNAIKVEQSLNKPVEKDAKPKPSGTIKEKKFVCDICLYQTNRKAMLQQHYLTHGNPSEVNAFKCDYCPFATKWKRCLRVHAVRHKNPSELPKFKCNDCPYETNKRKNLVKHVLVHRDLLQVNMYQCEVCSFKTKYKYSIVVHLRNHKKLKQPAKSDQNIKKVRQHKCNECSYVGTRKSHLIQHQMVHIDLSVRKKYTCVECSFQALYKITLQRHYKKNHSNLAMPFGALKTYRCNECDYETMYNKCFSKHLQTHEQGKMTPSVKEELQQDYTQDSFSDQNLKKVQKPKDKMQYKCNECSYVGKQKSYLIQHQMVHKDLSERKKYACIECSFQSLYKITLQRHYKKNHSNLAMPFGELKTYQCNECDYETTRRTCFSKHLQRHEQRKMTSSVKEELQEQDNTQDKKGS